MKIPLSRPICLNCKYYMYNDNLTPIKQKGIILKFGKSYCTANAKYKELKAKDKKIIPSWCARLNSPPILRIYSMKNNDDMFCRYMFDKSKREYIPSEHDYFMRHEGESFISAYDFYERIQVESIDNILDFSLYNNEVLEIDDGIRTIYFLINDSDAKITSFNGSILRSIKSNE